MTSNWIALSLSSYISFIGYSIYVWHKVQYIYTTVTDQRYKAKVPHTDQYHINTRQYCILEKNIYHLTLGEKILFFFRKKILFQELNDPQLSW